MGQEKLDWSDDQETQLNALIAQFEHGAVAQAPLEPVKEQ